MAVKYFYYISKTKIDMLLPQLVKKRFSISSLNPKVGYGGISLGADIKKNSNDDLISKTQMLINKLNQKKLVKTSAQLKQLDISDFYHDNGKWRNGIYFFNSYSGPPIVSYFLWRALDDYLILLVGSANHIIGERIAKGGLYLLRTGSAYRVLLNFVGNILETGEPNAVALGSEYPIEWNDILNKIENIVLEPSLEFSVKPPVMYRILGKLTRTIGVDKDFWTDKHSELFDHISIIDRAPNFCSLGAFCVGCLDRLPNANIDTIFKIFSKFDQAEQKDSFKYLPKPLKARLLKYKTIYIGSPVYTALN